MWWSVNVRWTLRKVGIESVNNLILSITNWAVILSLGKLVIMVGSAALPLVNCQNNLRWIFRLDLSWTFGWNWGLE